MRILFGKKLERFEAAARALVKDRDNLRKERDALTLELAAHKEALEEGRKTTRNLTAEIERLKGPAARAEMRREIESERIEKAKNALKAELPKELQDLVDWEAVDADAWSI